MPLSLRPLLLSAALALAATTSAHALGGKPAVDRKTVVVGIFSDIGNLDPQVSTTVDSARSGWQLFDTLYGFDIAGHIEPRLATAYQASADGLRYSFTLRRGVKFHDGSALTSADVKYSLERILEPETKSTRRPYFAGLIAGIDTPDAQTVVIRLTRRDGAFINKVAGYLYILPKAYTESLKTPEAFAQAPVGSGPYRLVSRAIGQQLVFERFDGYYGPKPEIEKLVFRVLPDANSRVNALLAGEVDIADDVRASDLARLRRTPGVEVQSGPAGSPLHVRLYSNVPNTPLARREVRLALNYAIDTEAIIRNVMHGAGAPLSSFISKAYPYGALQGKGNPYGYDPARARKLLAEAGYPNGFDTEVLCYSVYERAICEAVTAYWSQVGIRAKLKVIDPVAFGRLDNTHQSGPMNFTQFANAIYDPVHPVAGGASKAGTWSDYFNPEVEALLTTLEAESDRGKRDALFQQIANILNEDGFDVLLSEQFFNIARDNGLRWEPQRGGKFYNFRNVRWK
ncbi:MAG: ABC transporter substrate-binding protein [Pseudorhodoferax sp.]